MRKTGIPQHVLIGGRGPHVLQDATTCESVTTFPATSRHLGFIDRLRRRDAKALGFLSRAALVEKVRRGHVRVAQIDGQPAGFLLHGSMGRPEVRVFQLAVDPAHRGRGIARRLVTDLLHRALAAGARGLSLRCRETLPANQFWHRAGFELHDLERARRGALFVWVRRVTSEIVPPNEPIRTIPNEANRAAPNKANSRATGRTILAPNKAISRANGMTIVAPNKAISRANGKAIAATNEADSRRPNEATDVFRFHSRWHPCPSCGRMTCDTWTAGARRIKRCAACA